jgi:hypothetical protein
MDNEAAWRGQSTSAGKRFPVDLDEMSIGEFLDFLRWWTNLSNAEKRALLTKRQQMLH